MSFQFASCQWNPYAKGFIQKMYLSKIIEDDKIPKLIALINQDILRVQDPAFHQPCQIVAGTHYGDEHKTAIDAAIKEFTDAYH